MENQMISWEKHEKITEDIKAQQRYYFDTKSAQDERTIKRLWIVILVIFAAFVLSNSGWLIYESQYQDEVYTYHLEQDSGEGGENTYTNNRIIVGGDYHGETEGDGNGETPGEEIIGRNKDMP